MRRSDSQSPATQAVVNILLSSSILPSVEMHRTALASQVYGPGLHRLLTTKLLAKFGHCQALFSCVDESSSNSSCFRADLEIT